MKTLLPKEPAGPADFSRRHGTAPRTVLVPMLNLRLAAPENLIDLNGIADLAGIRMEGGHLVLGAMTRQRQAERSKLVGGACPLLADALSYVGHQQTRNRGTVGGSIAHMDPTAELPVDRISRNLTCDT